MHRSYPRFVLRCASFAASAAAITCLSGCTGFSGSALSSASSMTATIPPGSVHGGQQAVGGAHVFVFATGDTGYGSASTSLLAAGNLDTTAGSITNGDFYVTTDAAGNFTYGGLTVSCPSNSSQIYLLATGGNQGGAPPNSAIVLSASLGRCDTINASTFTDMNEITTVAMATALNQFMVDGAHVGAPGTNATGLTNAVLSIQNLVDSSTGTALATTPGGNGVAPQALLNTLGNIIASCVNSLTSNSAPCNSLFAATTPTSSPVPTNVLGAALNIAKYPAANVASLFSMATAAPPFQPSLAVQPNDFSVGITYSAPFAAASTGALVVDGSGNIWVVNCQSCLSSPPAIPMDTLVRYNPDGTFAGSFGAGMLHSLQGIAVDTTGNVWTVNRKTTAHPQDEVIEVLSGGGIGTPITNDAFGTNSLQGIAFDKLGTLWLTAVDGEFDPGGGYIAIGGQVLAMTTGGTILGSFNFLNTAGSPLNVAQPSALAVDNSDNIWVVGPGDNSLLKFTDTAGNPNVPSYVTTYNPTGFNAPSGIAINAGNELWITESNSTLSHLYGFNGANAAGSPLSNVDLFTAPFVTIDGLGQVIIPNCRVGCGSSGSSAPDNLLRLGYTGSPDTGGAGANYGVQVAGFSGPSGAASDASGAVWVSNTVSGTVTQVIGFAAPTIVPLSSAVASASVGVEP